jgi:hypothetical protein
MSSAGRPRRDIIRSSERHLDQDIPQRKERRLLRSKYQYGRVNISQNAEKTGKNQFGIYFACLMMMMMLLSLKEMLIHLTL